MLNDALRNQGGFVKYRLASLTMYVTTIKFQNFPKIVVEEVKRRTFLRGGRLW